MRLANQDFSVDPVNSLPGCHGDPSNGSSLRSKPHQPAVFQAKTSRTARKNRTGFVLAEPAIIKFQFMKPPKIAAMPVNIPRIKASPMRISPATTSFANQV